MLRAAALLGLATGGRAAAQPQCGQTQRANTLGYLHPQGVVEVAEPDAAACCGHCVNASWCASWSFQHEWTPRTPCHLSPYAFEKQQPNSPGNSCGTARKPQPAPPTPTPDLPPSPNGVFVIDTSEAGRRQVFEGVQVELQSDSIGSYNSGMPKDGTLVPDDDNSTIGAPHDLTPAERVRFATEVIKGARTFRLAMGIFLRGLGPRDRSIVGRWPSQMAELRQLQELSGIEGCGHDRLRCSQSPTLLTGLRFHTGVAVCLQVGAGVLEPALRLEVVRQLLLRHARRLQRELPG